MKRIPMGVSANYVQDWTIRQAIREAMQNIVYGASKMDSLPLLVYANGRGTMADNYIGLQKKHLYMGESEQRTDVDGLGTFGEGMKMFLLVFARNNIYHRVNTVGFSFWGEMTPTEEGVNILEIVVEDNDRVIGTEIIVECSEEDFNVATAGFALVQGIEKEHIGDANLIPDRQNELYIKGVRIENNDTTNPLNLAYSYSLKDASLTNRDRSTVNTEQTYKLIRAIWAKQASEDAIEDFITKAHNGDIHEDVQRGASGYDMPYDMRAVWKRIIAKVHKCEEKELVASSRNTEIDREAMYRGYCLINLPDKWNDLFYYLDIPRANEVIKSKFSDMEEVDIDNLDEYERKHFKRAKIDAKKALRIAKMNEFPTIKIVEKMIDSNGVTNALGLYDFENKTVYIKRSELRFQKCVTRVLIHEMVHHITGCGDNNEYFTRGFEDAILNLLGY